MLVYLRGAGDIASGIAVRLVGAGCRVVMSDIAKPTAIRRTVCFSEAIRLSSMEIEGIRALRAYTPSQVLEITSGGQIAVIVDPQAHFISELYPDVLVDAILAKKNCGTHIRDAAVVIGVGPGFYAGKDCHAVIETCRGHYLGSVIYHGAALENTGVPGIIAGHGADRVLRAPAKGRFEPLLSIGDLVRTGDVAATVASVPLPCTIDGVLRGLLAPGIEVGVGMKVGDIDPRGEQRFCQSVSDKARSIGGGVLEALLHLSGYMAKRY